MLKKSVPVVGVAAALLALAGCGPEARPQVPPPGTSGDATAHTADPVEEPAATPPEYRDTLNTDSGEELLGNGRFREFLAEHDGQVVTLDVAVYRNRPQGDVAPAPAYGGPDGHWAVTLPDDSADEPAAYFTFTVAEELFSHETDGWVPLVGEFTVTATESTDAPVFALEAVGDTPAPRPVASDEERCTSETVETDLYAGAEHLAGDSGAYAAVQEQWDATPRIWWAVKSTAATIASSNGQEYGDALSQVCGEHWAS